MINLFNLKNSIIGWLSGAGALLATLMLAIFKIRQGGRDAERNKHTEATLENVAKATISKNETVELLNNPAERKRLRTKWTRPRK